MESRAKLFGHPIHPMLIVIPLGLFIFSVICDILYFSTGGEAFSRAAFYNIAGGIIGGLLAALFGLIDYVAIPTATRAKRVGTWHLFGNLGVILLFSFSWIIRNSSGAGATPILAFGISVVALLLGAITAWLGGELVNRLGVGVDRGAHLDAPSSLSGRPAEASHARLSQVPVTGGEKLEDEP